MDVMTQLRLMWLGAWAVLGILTLGTATVLAWILDRRNRRRSLADSRSGEKPELAFGRLVGEGELGESQLR